MNLLLSEIEANAQRHPVVTVNEVGMVNVLLLLGAALVLAGYWASTVQAEQRRAVRIDVERTDKPSRRRD
jgi:hypothetical protein